MTKITRIKQQKDKNRVNIYLDDKFGFGVTLEELLKLGLKTDQELTDDQIKNIKEKDNKAKAYGNAIRFTTIRPRSEKEVELWFKRKKIEGKTAKTVLQKLKKLELVNDLEFAKWWVEQRLQFRPKSKLALKVELQQKGVDREITEQVLSQVSPEGEEEMARRIARKKLSRLSGLSEKKLKQKLTEYLARRGFSWNIIRNIVDSEYKKG